jgi:hypothetical protein
MVYHYLMARAFGDGTTNSETLAVRGKKDILLGSLGDLMEMIMLR